MRQFKMREAHEIKNRDLTGWRVFLKTVVTDKTEAQMIMAAEVFNEVL